MKVVKMPTRRRTKKRMAILDELFHETIAQRRTDMELTQSQVEARAGLWTGFMSYLETKRLARLPLPDVLQDLCDALEFTPAEAMELAGYYMSERDLAYLERRLDKDRRAA